MSTFLQDIRYGVRVLMKSPGFTIIAILTLALGIGANSTIFSWINSTVLNPVPGASDTSALGELAAGPDGDPSPISYPDYVDLRAHNHSLSDLTVFSLWSMDLTGNAKPQRVWGDFVSENYFDTLGVHAFLGRTFLPAEGSRPGGAPVVVVSYDFWKTQFGADRNIIDKTIQINKHPFTVIGIAPPLFQGTQTGVRADLWIPVMMIQQFLTQENKKTVSENLLTDRSQPWMMAVGRRKPGLTHAQAQADLSNLYAQIAKEYPDSHRGSTMATLYPMWRAPWGANYYLRVILFLLMAISGVVLLLACANVANLLLVRSVSRRREMAIRLSIGATRWRLVRQLLSESLILAFCGGGVAMLLTLWTSGMFGDFIPPSNIPVVMNYHADSAVLYATLGISLLTGIVFGILPALRSSSLQPVMALKEESGSASGGRRRARLSSALVVGQIAMSLLLLICAGLFTRSFRAKQKFNPGFNPQGVLLETYDLGAMSYQRDAGFQFDRQLLAKLNAIPGAQSAALAGWVPLSMQISRTNVDAEGYVPQPHESMSIDIADVSPDYLRTMQIPLLSGREFTVGDTEKSQPVAMVDQDFVRRYWSNEDALGKRVRVNGKWYAVVGVTANFDIHDLGQNPKPFVYLPLFQDYTPQVAIHLRVAGNPLGYVTAAESAVHSLDADLPLSDVATLQSRIELNSTAQRIGGVFVGAFGVLALILAAVGVYGVLAYTMRQRTHELGIRMALGAEPRGIFALVLKQGAILAFAGIAIGLAASFVLTRALSRELFGVSPADPLTYAGVGIALLAVALLACYIPARRAMRTDPMVALRYE
ncbi:MAG TPA: ABC transporter permease [Candidatus Acidoferrales bacterium]|nr:ABC transporter permease [Candidatus Acidoferrales bacterium]